MKEPCHIKKRETWIDGPMQGAAAEAQGFVKCAAFASAANLKHLF